jgi:hypothetical protein
MSERSEEARKAIRAVMDEVFGRALGRARR